MTPEQQVTAVAEWMGQRYHKPTEEEKASGSYYQYEPRYSTSLDAISEVEGRLHEFPFRLYLDNLSMLVNGEPLDGEFGSFRIGKLIKSTAPQRLEAICRTLWPERFK